MKLVRAGGWRELWIVSVRVAFASRDDRPPQRRLLHLEAERHREAKHEYVAGKVFAMPGASAAHERIAMNINCGLGNQLRGKRCEVFSSNLRVRIRQPGSMREVWQAVADALSDEKNSHLLASSALTKPLSHLESFLRYAKSSLPQVWRTLAEALTDENNRPALVSSALTTPPDQLASFLSYAKFSMPKVWEVVVRALENEKNRYTYVSFALAGPPNHLVSFLSYTKSSMPQVWRVMTDALGNENNLGTLTNSMMNVDFVNLNGFMSFLCSAMPNLAGLLNVELKKRYDTLGTEHPRLQALRRHAHGFSEAARVLSGCGCRPLAEMIAHELIQSSEVSPWQAGGQLRDLIATLHLGNSLGEKAVRRFLERVASEEWMKKQYYSLPAQMLAGAFYCLWAHVPGYICDYLLAEFPQKRVEGWIRFLHKAVDLDRSVSVLELLGASSLFELDVSGTTRWWPPQPHVDDIASHFSSALESETIYSHQSLFLVGLREMARRRPDRIYINREVGERVLLLLKPNDSLPINLQRLNAWKFDWLKRCAQKDWQLIKDDLSVPERVFASSTESAPISTVRA